MPIIHYEGRAGHAISDTHFSGVDFHERQWLGYTIEGRDSHDANGCGNEAGLPDCNSGGPILGSSTSTSSASPTASATHSSGPSKGVIVAATLIGVAVLVFAIMGIILLRRWRRSHTAPSAEFIRNEKAVQRMRNPLRRSLRRDRDTQSDGFSRISSVEAALLPKPATAHTHHRR
ncbi:hypothetical protein BDZ89DRAFT_1057688 [Hymenopellis radicata]|nr:hypothetical protein BDZ89DRAFT_1057688 [Hymenopellis radicata]